ncbi:MAG: ABC transporter permease subunit [Bacilli bacterium]
MLLLYAIYNEMIKLYRKRRLFAAVLLPTILSVGIGVFAYFHLDVIRQSQNWESGVRIQLKSDQHAISLLPRSQQALERNQIRLFQYELLHHVPPQPSGTGVSDTTGISMTLLFPLIIVILGGDIISGEVSDGTMKSMLIRPVGRSRIFLAKFLTLLILALAIRIYIDMIGYVISHSMIGGWNSFSAPILMGNIPRNGMVSIPGLHVWPTWLFILVGYGLNLLTMISVIGLVMLLSVLIRNPAMSVITSVIVIIIGGMANQLVNWNGLNYLPMTNFDLVSQILGGGISNPIGLPTAVIVLLGWCIPAGLLGYFVFCRKDFSI